MNLTLAGKDQENPGYLDKVEYVSVGCNSASVGFERIVEKRCLSRPNVFAKYLPLVQFHDLPFEMRCESENAN